MPLEGAPVDFMGDRASLVVAGFATRSPWWIGKALAWVEWGVWTQEIKQAVTDVSHDSTLDAAIRRRAERLARPQGLASDPKSFAPMPELDRWGRALWRHQGWRYAVLAVPLFIGMAIYAGVVDGAGAATFFGLAAGGTGVYGLVDWRRERGGE